MQNGNIKNFQNGISRPVEPECQDMPKPHINKTNNIKTYNSYTENSQSVSRNSLCLYLPDRDEDRQTDDIYKLDEIMEKCELDAFDSEERKILYDAIERLYYTKSFKIGGAELPQNNIRSRLYNLNSSILRSALNNMHRNNRNIKNITGYMMSTILTALLRNIVCSM